MKFRTCIVSIFLQTSLVAAVLSGCCANSSCNRAEPSVTRSKFDPLPIALEFAPPDAAGLNVNGARFGCGRDNGTKRHNGTDLKAPLGTDITALFDGTVIAVRNTFKKDEYVDKSLGNTIIVKVKDQRLWFRYAHLKYLETPLVKVGDTIIAGQVLGKTGRSGNAFNAPFTHLHFEASTTGFGGTAPSNYIDAEPYLKTEFLPNPNCVTNCPGCAADDT